MILALFFFFFFQAEDGIRDVAVTGVQTCALPILTSTMPQSPPHSPRGSVPIARLRVQRPPTAERGGGPRGSTDSDDVRSRSQRPRAPRVDRARGAGRR